MVVYFGLVIASLKYTTLAGVLSPATYPEPGFNSRPVSVRFIMDKMALVKFLLPVSPFSSLSIIPPMLHAHHRRYIILATTTPLIKHTLNCAFHFKQNI